MSRSKGLRICELFKLVVESLMETDMFEQSRRGAYAAKLKSRPGKTTGTFAEGVPESVTPN
jgi:hypothetical protein